MRLHRVSMLAACSLMVSCAHYNPYFNSAKVSEGTDAVDDGKPKKAYALSQAIQIELVNKANALANEENNTTLALAGALGLGAYKAATGGGHQVVALASGAGALYGVNQALYDQGLATKLHQTVSSLLCLDGAYNNIDPDRGGEIAAKIKAISPELWSNNFEASYQAALKNIAPWTEQYTTNIKIVVSTLNQRIAAGQLGPEDRYKLIVSSLKPAGAAPPDVKISLNPGTIESAKLTSDSRALGIIAEILSFNKSVSDNRKERQNQALYELTNEFNNWLSNSNALLNDPVTKVALCRTDAVPLSIPELAAGEVLKIKDQPILLKIVNSSGNITATTSPGAPVTAKITVNQKDLFLEIQRVNKATGDGTVYVTDYGKDEALLVVKVHVDQ